VHYACIDAHIYLSYVHYHLALYNRNIISLYDSMWTGSKPSYQFIMSCGHFGPVIICEKNRGCHMLHVKVYKWIALAFSINSNGLCWLGSRVWILAFAIHPKIDVVPRCLHIVLLIHISESPTFEFIHVLICLPVTHEYCVKVYRWIALVIFVSSFGCTG
jgi:hypothetical protein